MENSNNMRGLNKNAIVLPETLKLILAVLGILILIILAVMLYGIFNYKTELEQARENLNQITEIIGDLKADEEEAEYLVVGPKGWVLTLINDNLCFCPEPEEDKEDVLKTICEEQGICRINEFNLKIYYSYNSEGGYFHPESDYIPNTLLISKPKIFYFRKKPDFIELKLYEERVAEKIFTYARDYKGNGEKSIKDLSIDYVNTLGTNANKEIGNKLREQIKEALNNQDKAGRFWITKKDESSPIFKEDSLYSDKIIALSQREDIQTKKGYYYIELEVAEK